MPLPATSEIAAISTRLAVAMRRASCARPAPTVRETTAAMPIISPMHSEVWKKPTTPAKPTAAAMAFSPSSEM